MSVGARYVYQANATCIPGAIESFSNTVQRRMASSSKDLSKGNPPSDGGTERPAARRRLVGRLGLRKVVASAKAKRQEPERKNGSWV